MDFSAPRSPPGACVAAGAAGLVEADLVAAVLGAASSGAARRGGAGLLDAFAPRGPALARGSGLARVLPAAPALRGVGTPVDFALRRIGPLIRPRVDSAASRSLAYYSVFRNESANVPEALAATPHVLCVGVAVLDTIFAIERFPGEPTKTFARDFVQTGGGPAANGAVTIARLGGRASLWARVGDDAVGAFIVEEFARERVDATRVRRVPGHRSGVSSVVIDAAGERNITAFADRTLDPSPDWLPDDIPADAALLLCDVRWPAGSRRAMELARARGATVVLDADLTADDAVARLIGGATHAIFSAPALARLAETGDVAEGLARAQALTSGVVGVTRGREGFVWLEGGALRSVPAFAVDVVDTLAAGDVFHGAFALGLAEGRDIQAAGRFAAGAAALKCTRFGGRLAIPTRAELDRFMRSG